MVKYLIAVFLSLVLIGTTACQPKTDQTGTVSGDMIQVVAAENFWGSIAAQLGGTHVNVISIVTDPNADPHEFETNTADALDFAHANYVILNGAGYDTWGQKLLAANPSNGRKVLDVADLLGKTEGDNPHFWYDPDYVQQVINQITGDYQSLDPADAAYFSTKQTALENALTSYRQLIQSIKQTYGGTQIGGTESIVVYMADALGLDLISPPDFMNAVSEGNDPPTQSVAAFEQQINQKQISVLIYNNQTATAVTTNLKQMATAQGIPVVGISETMEPPDTTFPNWQYAQLTALQKALNAGGVSK
ncbi:MAG: zinc ABC transporter substrate-binding protein [Dehalococcoidales bacterium]|jgi:zinc/manganese transport system substrate-binding protein